LLGTRPSILFDVMSDTWLAHSVIKGITLGSHSTLGKLLTFKNDNNVLLEGYPDIT